MNSFTAVCTRVGEKTRKGSWLRYTIPTLLSKSVQCLGKQACVCWNVSARLVTRAVLDMCACNYLNLGHFYLMLCFQLGVNISTLIGGNASTIKGLRDTTGLEIRKGSDLNHLQKTVGNSLCKLKSVRHKESYEKYIQC